MTLFLTAVLALPLLLYLPGFVLSRVFTVACPADVLERHYERVVSSVLLNGWLALTLAEIGLFSLWLHLALLVALCLALWFWHMRTTSPHATGGAAISGETPPTTPIEPVAFALVGIIALLLVLPPFEVILGVRDAGVYANTGFATAHSGSLAQHDALLAGLGQAALSDDPAVREPAQQALSNFLGVQHPERFIATRMRAAGFFINEGDAPYGRVVPQGFHLFPAWIALLTSILGLQGGLFAPGLMGVLGAWSVGMLGRRLAGRWVGILAFLLLALNSVQVWFSRYSTAETTTQFLTFAGLFCFAACQQRTEKQQSRFAAVLAGLAFGQLALTRIDFVLVAVPVICYLLFCWLSHRWQATHTALALGFGAMLLHAGLHIIFIARAYFFDTTYARLQDYAITAYLALPFITPLLREVYHTRTASPLKDPSKLWRELGVLGIGVGALLALWRWSKPLDTVTRLLSRWHRPLSALAGLLILLLASYAYLVRPQVLRLDVLTALPRCLTPSQLAAPDTTCLKLQGYVGAPIALPPPPAATDPERVRTDEPSRYYEGGAVALLSHMGTEHPRYSDALGYKQRLLDLISTAQQQGDSAALQQERATIIGKLDELSQADFHVSFEELCRLNVFAPRIDDKYLVPLANLVRVGWYLSPLGVGLGVVGFALWWGRGLNRASWLFLVIGLAGTFFYVRQTYGTSDQTYIYILRRFVSVSYPTFSLGMAYALVAVGQWRWASKSPSLLVRLPAFAAALMTLAMITFFVWTGRPIYRHVEYAGALSQLEELASRFGPDDILLLRGGGPTYGHFRDVPDLVATPLHFAYGLNAFTVKSSEPARYADVLAAQVRRWQSEGHEVYLLLSASGSDVVLPGFTLQPVGRFTLHLPEFEQLTNQKPHTISSLTFPLAIYRLNEQVSKNDCCQFLVPPPLGAADFAAQVRGFYLPEQEQPSAATPDGAYTTVWTDGDALLRIPWGAAQQKPVRLTIRVSGGKRPAHMGAARLCLSVLPEEPLWPATTGAFVPVGCFPLTDTMMAYSVTLDDPQHLPPAASGTALLRLESETWVPAEEDPRMTDRRLVGIQFGGLAQEQEGEETHIVPHMNSGKETATTP